MQMGKQGSAVWVFWLGGYLLLALPSHAQMMAGRGPAAPLVAVHAPAAVSHSSFIHFDGDLGRQQQARLAALCAAGPRMAGTPANERAINDLARGLKAKGFKLRKQKLVFESWRRDTLFAEGVPKGSDNYQEFRALALYNTPNKVLLTAPLLDAGIIPNDSALFWGPVKGKVVMADWQGGELTRARLAEIVAYANRENAAGFILGLPVGPKALPALTTGEQIAIPAMITTHQETSNLRTWMQEERLMASVRMFNYRKAVKAQNLEARLQRGKAQNQLLIIAASDNTDKGCDGLEAGAGLIAAELLASQLSNLNIPGLGITVLAVNGQADAGQPGFNAWFAENVIKKNSNPYGAVIDLTGGISGERIVVAGSAEGKAPLTSLRQRFNQMESTEAPQTQISAANASSELQAAFTSRGVPVIYFGRGQAGVPPANPHVQETAINRAFEVSRVLIDFLGQGAR